MNPLKSLLSLALGLAPIGMASANATSPDKSSCCCNPKCSCCEGSLLGNGATNCSCCACCAGMEN